MRMRRELVVDLAQTRTHHVIRLCLRAALDVHVHFTLVINTHAYLLVLQDRVQITLTLHTFTLLTATLHTVTHHARRLT
jgi:uncharacterized protein YpiB (UPF0302 family)